MKQFNYFYSDIKINVDNISERLTGLGEEEKDKEKDKEKETPY